MPHEEQDVPLQDVIGAPYSMLDAPHPKSSIEKTSSST